MTSFGVFFCPYSGSRVLDSQKTVDLLVFRLRLRGQTERMLNSGMRILACDAKAHMGRKSLPKGGPPAAILLLPHPVFDIGQKVIGQNRQKEMRPGSLCRLVIDRSQAQIGFEGPEGLLDLGEGHVKRPDLRLRQVNVRGFDDVGPRGLLARLPSRLFLPFDSGR